MKNKLYSLIILSVIGSCFSTIFAQEKKFHFDEQGKFKIVQFTDIHYVKDKQPSQSSLDMMNVVLENEKPDMVVLTGDIVTGKPVKEGWYDVVRVLEENAVPYVVTFGNHDNEHGVSNEEIESYLLTFPGCMNRKGSIDTYGCANGVVAVNKARTDKPDLLIYYINSNAYSTIPGVEGYGWIETDQIDWYNRQAQAFRQANGDNPVPALSFFHIPLPEHAEALGPDKTKYRGTRIEKECAPQLNSGMFLNMLRQGGMMGAFVGHDHSNDYVAVLHGIALGYGRFSGSTNTYQDLISGARVIEVDSARPGEFLTWMRLADGSRKLPVRVSEGKVKALELMD